MEVALENAAQALADSDNLTLAQAREYRGVLYRRRAELEQQTVAIKDPNESGDDRWTRTLATGSEADRQQLAEEYDRLNDELERVRAQYSRFANMETVCRQREAEASIPDQLADLEAKADAVAEARAALDRACRDLDGAYSATAHTYRDATHGGHDTAQKPSESLVHKVWETAKGAAYAPQYQLYHLATQKPHTIGEQLRLIEPQGLVPMQ